MIRIVKMINKYLVVFIIRIINYLIKKPYMLFCNKIYGVNNKNIIFTSFGGKYYSDNPKAISEKINSLNVEFNIIWLFNEPDLKKNIVPKYVKCLKINTFQALKVLATSKFWIDNFPKPLYLYKSKNQIYIQTWHGDRGFKKILYDSTFIKSNKYRLFESKSCDLTIAGSDYGEMQYRSAFKYKGSILKAGCPRNDILVENSLCKRNEIKYKLKIKNDRKILLYAPTLRREAAESRKKQNISDINLVEILNILEKVTKENWILFIRAHSSISGLTGIPNDYRIKDVSNYEDMSDLLLISDILITDYSSTAGDFALLNKPIVLFQNDREEYIMKDRTFYFDPNKSPFIIANNQFELEYFIKNINIFNANDNCKEILQFYKTNETGKSSYYIFNYISSYLTGYKK